VSRVYKSIFTPLEAGKSKLNKKAGKRQRLSRYVKDNGDAKGI
jgi:hypothetical protein